MSINFYEIIYSWYLLIIYSWYLKKHDNMGCRLHYFHVYVSWIVYWISICDVQDICYDICRSAYYFHGANNDVLIIYRFPKITYFMFISASCKWFLTMMPSFQRYQSLTLVCTQLRYAFPRWDSWSRMRPKIWAISGYINGKCGESLLSSTSEKP